MVVKFIIICENNKLVDKIYLQLYNNYECDKFVNINEIYSKFNLEECKYVSDNYKSFICYNKYDIIIIL